MEAVKKIKIDLKYNKYNVTKDFSKYLQSITYTDYEEESSDELSVQLRDNEKLFQNVWYPEKGAKLTCVLGFTNSREQLNCGTFTIDENSFNFSSSGDTLDIKALAATTNTPLRTGQTTYYEKTTLVKIAQKIGEKHGFKVIGSEGNISIDRVNQVGENDLAFLKRISQNYGYVFKLTDGLLTFIKKEELTNSDVLFTLTKNDIKDLSLQDASTKVYKACSVKYYNPKTKKLCSYTATRDKGTDTLKITQKCTSKEQAIKIANARLKSGSQEITGSITLKEANCNFYAGVNFSISGFGNFDGIYHIKQSTHSVSNDGWEVSGEIIKC